MNKLVTLIIIYIISIKLHSQDLRFEQITTDDGLSQASVTCITQDRMGFIWFGTYDGLNRYDGCNFKIYKHDSNNPQSISNNFVRALLNDSRDLLWLGTDGGGLNIYDHETEQFFHVNLCPDGDSEGCDNIFSLFEDKDGSIWIGSWGGGLFRIIVPKENNNLQSGFLEKLEIQHFRHDPDDPNSILSNKISDIIQDYNGKIWIAHRDGIAIIDPRDTNTIKFYKHDPNDPNSLSYSNPSSIAIDGDNNIWITTWGGGLNKFDRSNNCFIRFYNDPSKKYSLSHNTLLSIFSDNTGRLWIGTWGGGLNLLPYKDNTYRFSHFSHDPKNETSINGNFIYDIYQDRTGVIWIGTDWQGVSKYNPDSEKFKLFNLVEKIDPQLSSNNITAICKDRYNKLWIGTLGGGLIKYDQSSGEIKQYVNHPEDPFSISNNTIRAIIEDRKGNLWFGTDKGLNSFNRKSEKFEAYNHNPVYESQSNVRYIFEDSDGMIWVTGWQGGLNKFDPQKKTFVKFRHNPEDSSSLSDNTVWCVTQDKIGNIWIGTDNGLNVYNSNNQKFRVFKHDKNNPNSLTDDKVLSLFTSQKGNIYIGTTGGLNILPLGYDLSKPIKFQHLTQDDGLIENNVQGIMEDNHGNIWLNNGRFLTYINISDHSIEGYNSQNILKTGELNINSRYKDEKSGKMFIGGIDGFVCFHPDSIKKNKYIPNVVLTDVKVLYNSVSVGDTMASGYVLKKSITHTKYLELSYKENNILLEMSALHFNAPQNNLYRYKLTPLEEEWQTVSYNNKIVRYNNLSPGEYTFQFSASNNDGIWNEKGNYLNIYIKSPFWLAWWFRIFVTIIIITLSIWGYRHRVNRVKKVNQDLERRVEERTIQLANINQELESFSYSVSHDLRAPLRAINGFSHALKEDCYDRLDNKGKEYLNRIQSASLNMSTLIDELLKLSRISKNRLHLERINLSEIVIFMLNMLKHGNPNRKTSFKIDPVVRAVVDRGLFEILLRNLIDNAWKFTSQNEVTEIEFGKLNTNNENIIYVKDNGIGFDMNYVDKLFEPFQRQNKEYEGTGIGLAIVNRIMKRHGGRIWAEGEPQKGSTFYFSLP